MGSVEEENITFINIYAPRDIPGGPVVKTLPSNAGSKGSIPGQGTKIPHALWPKSQNKTEAIL